MYWITELSRENTPGIPKGGQNGEARHVTDTNRSKLIVTTKNNKYTT